MKAPIATTLAETLRLALEVPAHAARRAQIQVALDQVEAIFAPDYPRTADDMTAEQAERILGALQLLRGGEEVYRLVVRGEVVKTFLAKNQWHAANHVKKHDGILKTLYVWAGRHEIHGLRAETFLAPEADVFARFTD